MADRLKAALVDSYTGAIAVGSLLSMSIYHMVTSLISPFTAWTQEWARQQSIPGYSGLVGTRTPETLLMAVPQLGAALVLLAISLALVKWLYYPEAEASIEDEMPEPREHS